MDIKLLFASDSGLRKKFIATIVILSIAIVVYTFLGFLSQRRELFSLIVSLYPTLLICILLIIPILGIKFIRWRLIGSNLSLRVPLNGDFRSWVSSQAFLATPGGSGLAIRSILLKKKYDIPISSTLSAIIFERLNDLTSIICLIILLQLNLLFQINIILPVVIILGLLIILRYGIISLHPKLIQKIIQALLNKINPTKSSSNQALLRSLERLFKPKLIFLSTLLGVMPWSIEGFGLYLIIKSIHGEQIKWASATFAHSASGLLGALSLLPGGLGTTEASSVGLLSLSGIPLDVATPSIILIRLLTIWLATIIGIFSLITPQKRI